MEFLCRCYVEWTGVSQPSPYPHNSYADAMLCGLVFPSLLLILTLWNSYADAMLSGLVFPSLLLIIRLWNSYADAMLSGLVFPSLLLILTLWNSYADAMLSGLVFPSLLLILTLWNSYAGCYVVWTGFSQPSPYPHTMEFLCRKLCRVDWCFPAFSFSSHYGILMQMLCCVD